MINIYAQTFMHATQTSGICMQDVTSVPEEKRHRWFKRRKTRCIDPMKL